MCHIYYYAGETIVQYIGNQPSDTSEQHYWTLTIIGFLHI